MKITKICPKCNSKDIIRIEGSVKGYGAGNNIPMGVTILCMLWMWICRRVD